MYTRFLSHPHTTQTQTQTHTHTHTQPNVQWVNIILQQKEKRVLIAIIFGEN